MSIHMKADLVDNVKNALEGCAVMSVYGWTDSMVALKVVKETTSSL